MDAQFVEKIVQEVKSQGVFDEFRKDSMADVDTKPAYQNLRKRVETTVQHFLSEQKWTPEANKIQLREKLRKHITESSFLDAGVERIVDQVVNPKIVNVFQPKIEAIAYKYLGLPPPEQRPTQPQPQLLQPPLPPLNHINGTMLTIDTAVASLLPTDLEQISPDSDKSTVRSEFKDEPYENDELPPGVDANDKHDEDDISPPFEPIIKCSQSPPIGDNETHDQTQPVPNEFKSNLDQIETDRIALILKTDLESLKVEEENSRSLDAGGVSQESQLSQVSSDSRITAVSNDTTADAILAGENSIIQNAAVNISEEAQMPKFNENSCEANSDNNAMQFHFDIKKDAIKFEGTDRKTLLGTSNGNNSLNGIGQSESIEDAIMAEVKKNMENPNTEERCHTDETPTTPNAQESSFGSYLDDTQSSANQLCIVEKSLEAEEIPIKPVELEKEKKNDDCNATSTVNSLPPVQNSPSNAVCSPQKQQEDDAKKELSKSSSSSTSRHKKHSKDKRHSDSKHRKHSRERDRSHDKSNSRSKHSRSSSKHSSTSGAHKSSRHDKTYSTQSSSTSSSRSSGANDSTKRNERRETDKKQKSSSSLSSNTKEHNSKEPGSSTNSKKSESKKSPKDDHNESKSRNTRRKSTDSNDDDRMPNGSSNNASPAAAGPTTTTTAATAAAAVVPNDTKIENNEIDKTAVVVDDKSTPTDAIAIEPTKAKTSGHDQISSKVVILNDILENPTTEYIELESGVGQIFKSKSTTSTIDEGETQKPSNETEPIYSVITPDETISESTTEPAAVSDEDEDLLFFDDNTFRFEERLKLLENLIESRRSVLNDFRFDSASEEEEDEKVKNLKRRVTEALLIDCSLSDDESSPTSSASSNTSNSTKRSRNDDVFKSSPSHSDSSINSKENEMLDEKNVSLDESKKLNKRRISTSAAKLNQQQRYTNDDLYKPRPILSQRSRRRRFDSIN